MAKITIEVEDPGKISDGHNSFQELYAHRIILFICLMRHNLEISWKSRLPSNGDKIEGWFFAGMSLPSGEIMYHIPDNFWEMLSGIKTLEKCPVEEPSSENIIRILNNWCYTL